MASWTLSHDIVKSRYLDVDLEFSSLWETLERGSKGAQATRHPVVSGVTPSNLRLNRWGTIFSLRDRQTRHHFSRKPNSGGWWELIYYEYCIYICICIHRQFVIFLWQKCLIWRRFPKSLAKRFSFFHIFLLRRQDGGNLVFHLLWNWIVYQVWQILDLI